MKCHQPNDTLGGILAGLCPFHQCHYALWSKASPDAVSRGHVCIWGCKLLEWTKSNLGKEMTSMGLDEVDVTGPGDSLGAAADAEFSINIVDVAFDRPDGNIELLGNFGV